MAQILFNSILLYFVYLIIDVNGLVGGSGTFITNYPFQVSIRIYDNHHLCGGSIISKWHVLTAASCVTSDVNVVFGNLKVLSGTSDVNDKNNYGTLSEVEIVIIHHNYSPRHFWVNDVSILKLTKSLDMTLARSIGPPSSLITQKFRLQVIGFDLSSAGKGRISKMIALSMRDFDCKKHFRPYGTIKNGQSCIIPKLPSSQIVEGDGGNPVFSVVAEIFVGIVSLITTLPNEATIITNLFGYYDKWMKLIIEKY